MTHLGDRIAAFVDGQLPVDERRIAEAHVAACDECRRKVREQRLLKSRMHTLGEVRAPDHLLASLSDVQRLAAAAEPRPSWLVRCLRSSTLRALVAVSGATVTVTALAYVIGGPADAHEGAVRPPVEQFAADFAQSAPSVDAEGDRIVAPEAVESITDVTLSSSLLVDERTNVAADDSDAVRLLRDAAGESSYLDQLVRNYRITTGTSGRIRGRQAVEVRAIRGGDVAAVFWIDWSTRELLRRLLYDEDGSVLESRDYGTEEDTATAAAGAANPSVSPIGSRTLDALAKSGWPCHDLLARDMGRVRGHWLDVGNEHVVRLTYTDGLNRLAVYEQRGTLDASALDGFEHHRVGGASVWLRLGEPSIAVWSADGVVYTIVTDASVDRLRHAVAELPHDRTETGTLDRIENGLQRMGSWVAPV